MINNILITTGYEFEGYTITECLGIIMGKSFYSLNPLKRDSDVALKSLVEEANSIGADAIIGFHFGSFHFDDKTPYIIAYGTAVKLAKIEKNPVTFTKHLIHHTNRDLPFSASSLSVATENGNYLCSLDLFCQTPDTVSGVLADIIFTNIFNDRVTLEDVIFLDFSQDKTNHLLSAPSEQTIDKKVFTALKSISVIVKKYVLNNNVIEVPEETIQALSDPAAMLKTGFNAEEFIRSLEMLDTSKAIFQYVKDYNDNHNNLLAPVLLEELKKDVELERFMEIIKLPV